MKTSGEFITNITLSLFHEKGKAPLISIQDEKAQKEFHEALMSFLSTSKCDAILSGPVIFNNNNTIMFTIKANCPITQMHIQRFLSLQLYYEYNWHPVPGKKRVFEVELKRA